MNKLTQLRTQWTQRNQGFVNFMLSWARSRHSTMNVELKDGTTAHIRPMTADDADLLVQILDGMGADSRYMRFNTPLTHIEHSYLEQLARKTTESVADGISVGFIAVRREVDGSETPLGKARYVRDGRDSAEIALSIRDDAQGLGLGTILLKHLVDAAQNDGLAKLDAVINRDNRPMQRLIHKLGLPFDQMPEASSVVMSVYLNGGSYGWPM